MCVRKRSDRDSSDSSDLPTYFPHIAIRPRAPPPLGPRAGPEGSMQLSLAGNGYAVLCCSYRDELSTCSPTTSTDATIRTSARRRTWPRSCARGFKFHARPGARAPGRGLAAVHVQGDYSTLVRKRRLPRGAAGEPLRHGLPRILQQLDERDAVRHVLLRKDGVRRPVAPARLVRAIRWT